MVTYYSQNSSSKENYVDPWNGNPRVGNKELQRYSLGRNDGCRMRRKLQRVVSETFLKGELKSLKHYINLNDDGLESDGLVLSFRMTDMPGLPSSD